MGAAGVGRRSVRPCIASLTQQNVAARPEVPLRSQEPMGAGTTPSVGTDPGACFPNGVYLLHQSSSTQKRRRGRLCGALTGPEPAGRAEAEAAARPVTASGAGNAWSRAHAPRGDAESVKRQEPDSHVGELLGAAGQ